MESGGAGPRAWSTAGRKDPFVHWREVVCQAYTQLSPERRGDAPFAGEVRMLPFADGGSLSRISASSQTVARRRQDIASRPCDAIFVNFQIGGASVVRQRGIETRLGPGSFVLLDARQPFAMRFDQPFRQLCLHLPTVLFDEQGFDPAPALARRIDRESAFGSMLMDAVAGVWNTETDAGTDAAAPVDIVHLLRLACGDPGFGSLADEHLALVRRFVASHSTDPDLSPAVVARHFRMSVRYLHKLFARSGESFGRYLLRCRLERSRRLVLTEPERPITDIAMASGFSDASHFSRSFRRRYGRSPRFLRRGAR